MNAPLTNLEYAQANTTAEQIWSAAYEKVVAEVKGFATYRRTPMITLQERDLSSIESDFRGQRMLYYSRAHGKNAKNANTN
jgi:hypothetical protein